MLRLDLRFNLRFEQRSWLSIIADPSQFRSQIASGNNQRRFSERGAKTALGRAHSFFPSEKRKIAKKRKCAFVLGRKPVNRVITGRSQR